MTLYGLALVALAGLQLALTLTHGAQIAFTQGLRWGMGRRDTPRTQTDFGRRLDRTLANNAENAVVNVPVLLLLALLDLSAPLSEALVPLYVACRFVFAGLYLANVPYIRSAVWLAGQMIMAGILLGLVLALN